MDKIEKSLRKLSNKERDAIKQILKQIFTKDFSNLDIEKLKNSDDLYRVRKGKIRIIYQHNKTGIYILTIERRTDTTYNKF